MARKVLLLAFSAMVALSHAQIIANLEQGGSVFWKFLSGQYSITGALTLSGDLSAGDPIEFSLQDLNGDGRKLDIRLCIQDLFPTLGIQYCLDLIGTVVSETASQAIVRWAAEGTPNQCVNVNLSGAEVPVFITRIRGALQARITPIACQNNPYNPNWSHVTLLAEDDGGDANNFLTIEGYLFCPNQPLDALFARAQLFNLDWEAYAGGFTGVFGNVNGDNVVDDADLLEILFNFGTNNPAADANGDGVVDDADLLLTLFNFGQSCN